MPKKFLILLLVLMLLGGFLRFAQLGYSEFQDDEKKAMIRKDSNESTFSFFLKQRKGPLQFVITSAVLSITGDRKAEIPLRLPFTFANLLAVSVFFMITYELTRHALVSFFGTFIFLSNGFIVGFSRIAQYQNLNILFSLLALYFFIKLSKTMDKTFIFSVLGTVCFSLSLLAHWDAVFFVFPVLYYLYSFLKYSTHSKEHKIKLLKMNLGIICSILLPFLIPYIYAQLNNASNINYFNTRIGFSSNPLSNHKFIFDLYNPFVTLPFLLALASLSIFKFRENLMYILWLLFNFFSIMYFMQKPGTHIYNYVIPLIILSTLGIYSILNYKFFFCGIVLVPLLLCLIFIYYQSFMLFIDNKKEYPWDEKTILSFGKIQLATKEYNTNQVLTFGFPHYRSWKVVNEIISNDPDNCTYITNEGKEIAQIYVDAKYGVFDTRKCYYIAEVISPFINHGKGAIFAQKSNRVPVYTYSKENRKLLRLYKIETKVKS